MAAKKSHHIGFKKLEHKIMHKGGYSEGTAAKIAASIGRKKLGAAKMAQKAAAGRRKASKGK